MAASSQDKLMEVGIATATTLDANYTINDTSITVASTSGWPTATGVAFAIDVVDSAGVQVPGTYNEYVGVVSSATSITSVDHMNGTDRNYSAGATTRVYIPVSAERENRIVEWGVVQHKQDGTHADTITTNTINENTPANGVTIDGLNIKDSKLVTANSVVTANITNDAVTATKIDWASTGADGGIWWEEIARTTLGTAGLTLTVSGIPNRKYLKVLLSGIHAAGAYVNMTFNGDSSTNYAMRYISTSAFGAAVSASQIGALYNNAAAGTSSAAIDILNPATAVKTGNSVGGEGGTSAATAPTQTNMTFKWVNTSDAISSITFTATSNFAIGSEVVVLGHN